MEWPQPLDFHLVMENVLQGLSHTVVYNDDILVKG